MKDQTEAAAEALAAAGEGSQSMPTRPVAGLTFIAVAAAAVAAGASLVGAGLVWAPLRANTQALSQGARLYSAECASCHGARLEGQAMPTRPDARFTWTVPPLGVTGHAWRHSDAELAGIVAHGTKSVAPPDGTLSMPAFAERLDPGEIDAVLAYLKTSWPASVKAYQASLNPGAKTPLAALLRNPAWVFPGQCQLPPAQSDRATGRS